jgi:hypothetical protein
MTTSATIPASFQRRARRHLLRTGQPLLFGPRRRFDLALIVDRNESSERWGVLADPRSVPVLLDELVEAVQESDAPETPRFTDLMLRLSKYAAIVVKGLPNEFRSENGDLVGRMDVADHCLVFVSNALAVSCLSWILRYHEPRIGFYLVNEAD